MYIRRDTYIYIFISISISISNKYKIYHAYKWYMSSFIHTSMQLASPNYLAVIHYGWLRGNKSFDMNRQSLSDGDRATCPEQINPGNPNLQMAGFKAAHFQASIDFLWQIDSPCPRPLGGSYVWMDKYVSLIVILLCAQETADKQFAFKMYIF